LVVMASHKQIGLMTRLAVDPKLKTCYLTWPMYCMMSSPPNNQALVLTAASRRASKVTRCICTPRAEYLPASIQTRKLFFLGTGMATPALTLVHASEASRAPEAHPESCNLLLLAAKEVLTKPQEPGLCSE